MKKLLASLLILSLVFVSCSRSLSPYQAANGKAGKCGTRHLR
jgi:hypothetical protein